MFPSFCQLLLPSSSRSFPAGSLALLGITAQKYKVPRGDQLSTLVGGVGQGTDWLGVFEFLWGSAVLQTQLTGYPQEIQALKPLSTLGRDGLRVIYGVYIRASLIYLGEGGSLDCLSYLSSPPYHIAKTIEIPFPS